MKKRLLSLLLAAIFLLSVLPAAAADSPLSTQEELMDLFARQKAEQQTEFEFTCERELFDELMADNARLLNVLQRKSGIASARVQYGEKSCLIKLSDVQYTDAPWVECATEEEACLALRAMLREGTENFALLCSTDLARELAGSGLLRLYAAQAGMEDLRLTYYTTGIIQVQDPVPFAGLWAPVEDLAQFDAAVETFALREADEFIIVFSPAFYETLQEEETRSILHASSMLDRYSYADESLSGVVHYTHTSYTDQPSLVCRSVEELQEAISHLAALKASSFRFYLADEELRALLMDTPLGYLHREEYAAGLLYTVEITHNSNFVYYTNATFAKPAALLSTAEEAEDYLAAQVRSGAGQVSLYCTPELYSSLAGEPGAFPGDLSCLDGLYAMIARAGIRDYELSLNRPAGAVRLQIRGCCPALELLRAVQTETVSELPASQRKCLAAALDLAASCQSEDPAETSTRILLALADITLLPEGEDDEADTAVGALLRGEASPKGLADAYYLVGSLAGLELRYPTFSAQAGCYLALLRTEGHWAFVLLDAHQPPVA